MVVLGGNFVSFLPENPPYALPEVRSSSVLGMTHFLVQLCRLVSCHSTVYLLKSCSTEVFNHSFGTYILSGIVTDLLMSRVHCLDS